MHRATLAAALIGFAGAAAAQADPNLGRNLAATCATCHGTNGHSVGGNESLAGKPREDLVKTMQDFKAGRKPATLMHQLSKGFSDAQIEAIAQFFSQQQKRADR
jgi:cytochrome subunit of sulfide dehydrogenase